MMRVKELANHANTTTDTVRFYTKQELLRPIRNPENNYKLYSSEDGRVLRFILQAKKLGFTLKEIKQILHIANVGDPPCPKVRNIIEQRCKETECKLAEIQMLLSRMQHAVSLWQALPDKAPDGDSICHLIETWCQTEKDGNHE